MLTEATSTLDLDNEDRVREAIEHLHGDLTVVIIGHRLGTNQVPAYLRNRQRGQVTVEVNRLNLLHQWLHG